MMWDWIWSLGASCIDSHRSGEGPELCGVLVCAVWWRSSAFSVRIWGCHLLGVRRGRESGSESGEAVPQRSPQPGGQEDLASCWFSVSMWRLQFGREWGHDFSQLHGPLALGSLPFGKPSVLQEHSTCVTEPAGWTRDHLWQPLFLWSPRSSAGHPSQTLSALLTPPSPQPVCLSWACDLASCSPEDRWPGLCLRPTLTHRTAARPSVMVGGWPSCSLRLTLWLDFGCCPQGPFLGIAFFSLSFSLYSQWNSSLLFCFLELSLEV